MSSGASSPTKAEATWNAIAFRTTREIGRGGLQPVVRNERPDDQTLHGKENDLRLLRLLLVNLPRVPRSLIERPLRRTSVDVIRRALCWNTAGSAE